MAAEDDTRQHRETYDGFMKLLMRSTAAVVVTLLLMLFFLV